MNKSQVCPLCQQSNHCQVNNPAGCWCMQQKVPTELTALLPASAVNNQCICASCITSFKQNPQQYKQTFLTKA